MVLLREVGHNPLEFGLGETPGGVRAHVSLRGDRQVELHHHFPIRRLDNEQKIVFAGSEIDILDFTTEIPERGAGCRTRND